MFAYDYFHYNFILIFLSINKFHFLSKFKFQNNIIKNHLIHTIKLKVYFKSIMGYNY
jgi:hypothetical protein